MPLSDEAAVPEALHGSGDSPPSGEVFVALVDECCLDALDLGHGDLHELTPLFSSLLRRLTDG